MYCTNCGHPNPDDANYCAHCGRHLQPVSDVTTGALKVDESVEHAAAEHLIPELDVEAQAIVDELAPNTALLLVGRGPNQGARFLLDRDVTTVGRHPASDIFLDDITVSRRHAEFRRDGSRFWVHDVGSLNGTYVGGRRAEDQLLTTGDEVQIGKFKLMVFVGAAA
jgi:hypothetical protein